MADTHLDMLREILELAGGTADMSKALDPVAFHSRVKELTRGGLPGQSMSDGRGSSESKLPAFDKVDQVIRRKKQIFDHAIKVALDELRAARNAQSWMLEKAEDVKEDPLCTNPDCELRVSDGKHSECGRCRVHRSRHKTAWTKSKEPATA